MSEVDGGPRMGEPGPTPAQMAWRRGQENVGLRTQVRDFGRRNKALAEENAELRRRVERLESVDFGRPPADPDGSPPAEPATQEPAPKQVTEADVQAERAARVAAEAAAAEAHLVSVGVTPEVRAAMALTESAGGQALSRPDGLEGIYTRLKDRSVPWPTLQQELRAYGFRDPEAAETWDGHTR